MNYEYKVLADLGGITTVSRDDKSITYGSRSLPSWWREREVIPTGRLKYRHHPDEGVDLYIECTFSIKEPNRWKDRILSRLRLRPDPGPVTIHLNTVWIHEYNVRIVYKAVEKIFDCRDNTTTTLGG